MKIKFSYNNMSAVCLMLSQAVLCTENVFFTLTLPPAGKLHTCWHKTWIYRQYVLIIMLNIHMLNIIIDVSLFLFPLSIFVSFFLFIYFFVHFILSFFHFVHFHLTFCILNEFFIIIFHIQAWLLLVALYKSSFLFKLI